VYVQSIGEGIQHINVILTLFQSISNNEVVDLQISK